MKNKPVLITLIAVIFALTPDFAMAATNSDGSIIKVIALAVFAVGLAIGLTQQSILSIVIGIVVSMMLIWFPEIINTITGATPEPLNETTSNFDELSEDVGNSLSDLFKILLIVVIPFGLAIGYPFIMEHFGAHDRDNDDFLDNMDQRIDSPQEIDSHQARRDVSEPPTLNEISDIGEEETVKHPTTKRKVNL